MKVCERRNFDFLRWVVCPLKTGLYKLNGRSGRRHARPTRPPGRLSTVKTHKNQSFSSHTPSNGMFFVIPEMPSKTFCYGLKKLPDHFKVWVHPEYLRCGEKCNKYDVAVLTTKKTVIMSEVETRTYVVHIEPWYKPGHTKWCRGVYTVHITENAYCLENSAHM